MYLKQGTSLDQRIGVLQSKDAQKCGESSEILGCFAEILGYSHLSLQPDIEEWCHSFILGQRIPFKLDYLFENSMWITETCATVNKQ